MRKFHDNRYVWIIGCSSGIGRALAVVLSERGVKLVLSARRQDKLDTLNEELGGGHLVCPVDVGDHQALVQAMEVIGAHQITLGSAIFLPAVYVPHDDQKKDIAVVHNMLRVNLGGAFNMVDVVQPVFEAQGHGQIVLCGSVAGYRGLPTGQPYCASKAAIINYAESLKMDLAPYNIDVKVINPGFVRTPLTDKNAFPMPMMIEAEDAAKAIAKGLVARPFEIHFPKKFTYIMKFLHILPPFLYFFIMGRVRSFLVK